MTPEGDSEPARLAPGLYVVATPIGNLGDISRRAIEILEGADLVLAEDRRMASKLLRHIGVSSRVENYNDHNAAKVRPSILSRLAEGQAIALTSDAGTPLISDPGYKLVDEARNQESVVHAVPGPSAVTAALSVSGLATDRFLFMGFPPPKQAARQTWLSEVETLRATLVLYESPRRLQSLLADGLVVLGDRPAVVARELTKLHEEVRRGSLSDLAAYYQRTGDPRGEIVVLIGSGEKKAMDWSAIQQRLAELLKTETPRAAVDLVAAESGANRREVYRAAMALKDGKPVD